jgi:hypothetical protein
MIPLAHHPESPGRSFPACLRRGWLHLAVAILLFACGCATTGGGGSSVDELHLLTIPLAINFDTEPGADGFAIKVYASRASDPKPVSMPRGSMEILMYDGVVRAADLEKARPLRTWSFAADALRDHQYRTSIGVGYQFALAWGDARPAADHITVLARYRSPEGQVIASLPGSIVTSLK